MTALDVTAALVVIAGALLGVLSGALSQLMRTGAIVAGVVVPYLFAGPLSTRLAQQSDWPHPVVLAACAAGLAFTAYLAVRLLTMPARAWLNRMETVSAWDQAAGGLLGAVKATGFVWLALSFLALMAEPLERRGARPVVLDGELLELAADHNAVALALTTRRDEVREAVVRFRRTGSAALPDDERLRRLLSDREAIEALVEGRQRAVALSDDLLQLLTDGAAMKRLRTALSSPPAKEGARQAVADPSE